MGSDLFDQPLRAQWRERSDDGRERKPPSPQLRGKVSVGAYWEKALRLIPDLRFEKLVIFIGARSIALHYRNQTGRLVIEVFEFCASERVVRAAAHYA